MSVFFLQIVSFQVTAMACFFFFFYCVMDILGILSLWVLFKRQSGCLEKFADPGWLLCSGNLAFVYTMPVCLPILCWWDPHVLASVMSQWLLLRGSFSTLYIEIFTKTVRCMCPNGSLALECCPSREGNRETNCIGNITPDNIKRDAIHAPELKLKRHRSE